MARTKIVATLGPATSSPAMIEQLIDVGADVFRVNFSHGTREENVELIRRIRRISRKKKLFIGIIADLSGPKVRCGTVDPPLMLNKGDEVIIYTGKRKPCSDDKPLIPLPYPKLIKDLVPGERVIVGDGEIELTIEEAERSIMRARVSEDGYLSSHKGFNFPDTRLKLSPMTNKDKEDVRCCVNEDIDFFALSFVRHAQDIRDLRRFISKETGDKKHIPVIAKIEKAEALHNIEEIIEETDGIMVARGDLGIEIPLHEVPLAQKHIINLANDIGKPVITATQMMESMIKNARPTRAEVTDIANAILDGTDAVMLSGETAIGEYPVRAVAIMDRVATSTEREIKYKEQLSRKHVARPGSVPDAISHATCVIAENLGLEAIVCLTISGITARMVARYRQRAPVLAFSPSSDTLQRLSLSWGLVPAKLPQLSSRTSFEKAIERAIKVALDKNYLKIGDRVAVTAGLPLMQPGTTDILRVVSVE